VLLLHVDRNVTGNIHPRCLCICARDKRGFERPPDRRLSEGPQLSDAEIKRQVGESFLVDRSGLYDATHTTQSSSSVQCPPQTVMHIHLTLICLSLPQRKWWSLSVTSGALGHWTEDEASGRKQRDEFHSARSPPCASLVMRGATCTSPITGNNRVVKMGAGNNVLMVYNSTNPSLTGPKCRSSRLQWQRVHRGISESSLQDEW
jgi:hypothetical protein